MMAVVKNLMVRCGADFSALTKATKTAQTSMTGMQKSVAKSTGAMTASLNTLKAAAGALGVVLGAAAVIKFGKDCVTAASDLQEVQNVVDVTFGDMSSQVDDFAKNAIESFGLSETAAKKYSGTMGAMLKSMGMTTKQAAAMSTEIAGLAGDMASFYNLKSDEAFAKIRSGISGETEPLKQLGINMSVVNLQSYAMSQGITKSYQSMTQAEQALLRYNYLLDTTSDAQGDFARTSGSWANQTRILAERFNQLKVELGTGLIQALTPAIRALNTLMAKLVAVAATFRNFTAAIFGKQTAAASANAEAVDTAADAQNNLAGGISGAAKAAKQSLASFDSLNVLQQDTGSSGGGGGSDASGMAVPEIDGLSTPEIDTSKTESSLSGLQKILTDLKNIDLTNFNNALAGLKAALEPFKENVGNGLKWLWDNALLPFTTWVVNSAIPSFFDLLSSALGTINSVIEVFKPFGQWLWENFLQPIATWTGGVIVSVIDGIAGALRSISDWISNNKTLVEDMVIVVGSFFAAWKIYNLATTIGGIVTALATFVSTGGLATAVTTALGVAINILCSPVTLVVAAIGALIAIVVLLVKHWDDVKAAGTVCWNKIKEVWTIASDWFSTNVVEPVKGFFSGMWDGLKSGAETAWTNIKTAFDGVKKWFDDNIITPVTDGFKAFFNGIISFAESFVNFFIRGINKIIDALNLLKIDIPDWVPGVGGKTFGFSLGQISELSLPRLANGGIVDGSTLANIGEAGREAVLPLENNTGWMDALAEKIGGNIVINASGEAGLLKYLSLKLDKESARRGRSLIVGGAL